MQYDASDPEHYISMLEEDWRRETLLELRRLIQKSAPQLMESIQYKMLSYSTDKGTVFHLNAQKHYVSLYVGDIQKIDPTKILLEGLDLGKGCIRFKRSVVVADTQIKTFIEQAVRLAHD